MYIEICMNDLEKVYKDYPVGTCLVCEENEKIYMYLCTSKDTEKPYWTQFALEYDIPKKLKSMPVVDKLKWHHETLKLDALSKGINIDDIYYNLYKKIFFIKILKDVAFCVVEETSYGVNCTKNREDKLSVYDCKDYDFIKVKISELICDEKEIQKLYYGKNVWLLLEQ